MRIVAVKGVGVIGPHVMDGYIDAFKMLGHDIFELEHNQKLDQDFMDRLTPFSPQLAIGYGATPLIHSSSEYFFRKVGLSSILLHYDCPFRPLVGQDLAEVRNNSNYYVNMIWDKRFAVIGSEIGLNNIFPIMLAVNPSLFYPDQSQAKSGVCFVGNISSNRPARETYQPAMETFIAEVIEHKVQNIAVPLLDIIEGTRNEPRHKAIAHNLQKNSEGFWKIYYSIHSRGSLEIRKRYITSVRSTPVTLYAETDPNCEGVIFKGTVDYRTGLRSVYTSHAININISSLQLETSVNNRVFDCFASGGFLLSDYRDDMQEIFPDFWEEITFRSTQEMNEKIDYYLANPVKREELTQKAQEIVLTEHTYQNRAKYIAGLFGM
jgi:spore maturation protein CgeB